MRFSVMVATSLLFLIESIASAEALPTYERVRIIQSPYTISNAELTDQNGKPFRLSQLNGRVALIFFGFTNCPDVCPTAMGHMRQLQVSGRIEPAEVAFVMISVDGERDTSAAMKSYLKNFSDNFIGLTGDPRTVKPIVKEFKAAFFKGSPTSADDGYSVSHSPQVFVVDTTGRLRAEFYSASVDAMAGITNALILEGSKESTSNSN